MQRPWQNERSRAEFWGRGWGTVAGGVAHPCALEFFGATVICIQLRKRVWRVLSVGAIGRDHSDPMEQMATVPNVFQGRWGLLLGTVKGSCEVGLSVIPVF